MTPDREQEPTPVPPGYTRQQVLEAYRPFIDRGVTNPDDLDLDDPEVQAVHAIFDAWRVEQERIADQSPDPAANLELNLSLSTFYIEAGFTDPDYVEEVANDWLTQDLERAREAGLDEVASKIQAKIDELNATLV